MTENVTPFVDTYLRGDLTRLTDGKVDDPLILAFAEQSGLTPLDVMNALKVMVAPVEGQMMSLVIAQNHKRNLIGDLHLARTLRYGEDGKERKCFSVFDPDEDGFKEGKNRRDEYERVHARIRQTSSLIRQELAAATTFAAHIGEAVFAAAKPVELDEEGNEIDSEGLTGIAAQYAKVSDAMKEPTPRQKRRIRKEKREIQAEVKQAMEDLGA